MRAKTALLAVLANILRKFVSRRGGRVFLYKAGCSVVHPSLLKSTAAEVYQAIPKPSTLRRWLRKEMVAYGDLLLSGGYVRVVGKYFWKIAEFVSP